MEFTADMQYMVWFEMTDRQGNGIVRHCGVNPQTGGLVPADGKGFGAFESTIYGRANPGLDVDGAYYVGADRAGNLLLVRDTGETRFTLAETLVPPASGLSRLALAQSAEPILCDGQAYVAYQINEAGRSFWDVTFGNRVQSGCPRCFNRRSSNGC